MNVILIGMKHCGKSSVGAELARRRGAELLDLDAMIEQLDRRRTGAARTVRRIFADEGEAFFRRIEAAAAAELYLRLWDADADAVIAPGGRAPGNPAAAALLAALGPVVYLRAQPEQLYQRVLASGLPPFLDGPDPEAQFHRLCEQRAGQYEQLATITVETAGLDVPAVADAVIAAIEERIHGR